MAETAKPGPKGNREATENRRREVARLDRIGWTQWAIADELGVSQRQIAYDMDWIRQHRIAEIVQPYEQKVAGKVDALRWVQREAAEAWDKAKGEFLKELIEQIVDQNEAALKETGKPPTEFKIRVKSQPDSAYLNTFLNSVMKQAGLLGLELEKAPAPPSTTVNVGVQVNNLFDLLSDIPDGPVPDEVEKRIQDGLANPNKPLLPIGLKELPREELAKGDNDA